jgi:hypothetical protein
MIHLGDNQYRLCLLDTNAVSEMAKHDEVMRHFLTWSLSTPPFFIPCYSLFTVLEVRRSDEVYRKFIERFGPLPSMIVKSHEQLLEDETHSYPDPSAIDPTLLGFAGELGADGTRLAKVLPHAFGTKSILDQERGWNEARDEIVEGIGSLVSNFPPQQGDAYALSEVRLFLQIAGLDQLRLRALGFAESVLVENGAIVDIDAFPSLKATLYTVFHKFYADRTRKPSRSDAFDIMISAVTPYVEAIITENHQAEVLRKTKNLDTFLQDLEVFTLRDFREAAPA